MKSMTGYGYTEFQDEKIHITLEIKSYNNRYLDIIINQPVFLNPLEAELRKFISSRAERGRVEVYIRVRELEEDIVVHLDKPAVAVYSETLNKIKELAGIEQSLELSHFLALDGILKTEKKRDIDHYRELLAPMYEEGFRQWDASRQKEGAETEADIRNNINGIYSALELFEQKGDEMESEIRNGIASKFQEVLGSEIDEQRILTETAVLLVKYTINEEIMRLRGHLDSFIEGVESGEAVGKKLDFICQEINREVNTIGSKSTIFEVNKRVVEVKDNLEKIREQLRNVE